MSARLRFAGAAAILVGACAVPAYADQQRVVADGTVFRADIEARSTGTAVRITRQKPAGGKDLSYVPGTDDTAVERDLALEVDPNTGRPALVWARSDGSGFNIYLSRYDGTWSTPRLLARLDGDDIQPQIRIDRRYVHISWRQEYLGLVTYWRASFLATTLAPAFGPERVPTDDAGPFSAEDDQSETLSLTSGSVYFCGNVFNKVGEAGRAFIWGVRDEPVPINYRQGFLLPMAVRSVVSSDVAYLGNQFTFWLTTPDSKLFYTTLTAGRWTEFRVIELTSQIPASEARWLITELNQRLASGGR
jgi:hypothetical protein